MALSGTLLGDAIKSSIDGLTDAQKQDRTQLFEAMGTAIVNYIKTNALVTVAVASVSGVTPGGGASGPGTGTGTIS
ncbi:MAG TPA: hypothetical protein VIY48_00535 [Candidatus Paceibacterota bacterium]